MNERNYDQEFQDGARKYAYDFDTVLRRYMMRAFAPWLPRGRALEMGCYKGDMTELIADHYRDLTVIEASGELVDITSQRLGSRARFVRSTFESTDLVEQFDAVFLIHTLEHLDDPIGTLRRVRGWLTEGGRLFVAVPNANAPSRQIAVHMGLVAYSHAVTPAERDHGHRRTYSLDTLEHDAQQAGLRVAHRGGVFFKPLANFQFDRLMGTDILSNAFLDGCYELGMRYPDLCASVFLVCER